MLSSVLTGPRQIFGGSPEKSAKAPVEGLDCEDGGKCNLGAAAQGDTVSMSKRIVNYLGSAEGQRNLQRANTFLAAASGSWLGFPGIALSAAAGAVKGMAENKIEGYQDEAKQLGNVTALAILHTVPAIAGFALSSILTPFVGAPAARIVGTVVAGAASIRLFSNFEQFEGLPGFRPPEPWEK